MVILDAGASKPRSLNFPITEAFALQEGLITVLQKRIKKIQVERDSKLIIDRILELLLFLGDLTVSTLIFRSLLLDNLNILSSVISIEKLIFLRILLPLLVTQVGT
jgi:hypothetical protein